MNDLISRKALMDYTLNQKSKTIDCNDIARFPAVEAEPVRHGRWEDKPTGAYRRWQSWCTACGKHSGIGGIDSNRHKPYCPNCGAKMDLEGDDGA